MTQSILEEVEMDEQTESAQPVILVVDDEDSMRSVIKRVLEDKYPQVLVARNGSEALEMLKERHVDIMITDYMMPLMDGGELIHSVRETIHPTMPIILVTGSSPSVIRVDPMTHLINKPFKIEELLQTIDRIVET